MATAFNFELVSPEKLLLSEDVTQVVVPGTEGYFAVMANHAPTMSTLQPGIAEVTAADGAQTKYVIFGGFIDVTPDSCTLLAESAVAVADITKDEVEARIAAAREAVEAASDDQSRAHAQGFVDQLTTLQGELA